MPLLTPAEITNWYLYGQSTTPANLATDAVIRPSGITTTIQQNVADYMSSGGGRFAIGSSFDLVKNFFGTDPIAGGFLYTLQPGVYTKAQLAATFGLSYYGLVLRQQQLDDGVNDYAERAYIWNSGEFKIDDGALFVVAANGARTISNFAVVPTGPDNFDFASNDIIAGNAGAQLQREIDPSEIGRKVIIEFGGSVATRTYTSTDFQNDQNYTATWSSFPQLTLSSAIRNLENNLWSSGVIKYLDGDKPIIYGTLGDDTLSSILLQNHYYLGAYLQNGVVIIAGNGVDVLRGGPADDRLEGGADNDTLSGFGGNDTLDGGAGVDTADYVDSPGAITIDFSGQEPADLNQGIVTVTNDGYGGQDTLRLVEKLRLSDRADTVRMVVSAIPGLASITEVDGGAQASNTYDTLDVSIFNQEVVIVDGALSGANTQFKNFELIIGGSLGDTIKGGSADDKFKGSAGQDTLKGDGGNDYLDGGLGTDTALFDDDKGPIELSSGGAQPNGISIDAGDTAPFFTVKRGTETDVLHSIEKIRLSENADTLRIAPNTDFAGLEEIDAGGQVGATRDVLDLSQWDRAVRMNGGKIDGVATEFKNFESMIYTPYKDERTIKKGDAGQTIDGGAEKDTINYGELDKGLTIDLREVS